MKRVLVAMSGGVDSSVAAALLQQEGYEVAGATMVLHSGEEGEKAVSDAKNVCDVLGIPHRVIDLREQFEEQVITPFIEEYRRGRTPNPCMFCNRQIKFGWFYQMARRENFDQIATGHYAKVTEGKIQRTERAKKEQTYVFALVRKEVLKNLLLPCGVHPKSEIRELAAQFALPVADKSDSQEICFIEDNNHAAFIERRCGVAVPGNFIDETGKVLGQHRGIYRYTIGQRKGLGISFPQPMFVRAIDAEHNTVVLTPPERLFSDRLTARALNFHLPLKEGEQIFAQPRYNAVPAPARIFFGKEGQAEVRFDEPQRALTPGQVVAFYRGDTLAGGGIIEGDV